MDRSVAVWLETLFHGIRDDLQANFNNRIATVENAFVAELRHLHDRQVTIASALHALLIRDQAMSDLTDAIRSEIASVSSDFDALIAQKAQDDTSALDAIKSDMDALKSKVAAALAPAASTSGTQPSGADTGTSAPTTSVGPTSTTATTNDGATTTVDHSTGSASTVDASGAPVATDDAAAQAARDAAAQAGVVIPAA